MVKSRVPLDKWFPSFVSVVAIFVITFSTFITVFYMNNPANKFSSPVSACTKCSWTGYRCDGKKVITCKNKCVVTVKTCPSNLSCKSGSTTCVDNCKEGAEKCPPRTPEPDDNVWIKKCVNDKWVNDEYGPDGCCECSGDSCYFSC